MPSFMALDTSTGIVTVNSASNSEVKVYLMTVTMTTPDSGDQQFATVTI